MHFQHRNPQHDRSHRISLMPMAHRTNAQGGSFVRQLRDLSDDARDAGETSLLVGVMFLAACLAAIIALILFLEPPAASPDVRTSASSGTPPSHASSVSAHGQQGSH